MMTEQTPKEFSARAEVRAERAKLVQLSAQCLAMKDEIGRQLTRAEQIDAQARDLERKNLEMDSIFAAAGIPPRPRESAGDPILAFRDFSAQMREQLLTALNGVESNWLRINASLIALDESGLAPHERREDDP